MRVTLRPIQARFHFGSGTCSPLTSPHASTRRLILQQARSRASPRLFPLDIALLLTVDAWFQVLFHSPPGVLFTFPSRYYALSVTKGI